MAQTFTPCYDAALEDLKNTAAGPEGQDPPDRVLENILSFSRNLEVKESRYLEFVDFLKS